MKTMYLIQVDNDTVISLSPNGTKFENFRKFYLPCSPSLPEHLRGKYLVTADNVADMVLDTTIKVYVHSNI